MDAREVSRFLQGYAKSFAAGAFATPTAAELAKAPGSVVEWGAGLTRTVAVARRLTRESKRVDFTGRGYLLPKGATLITHLARAPLAPVPNLDDFDYVYAYREDQALSAGLEAQGREVRAIRVSAASELIACWGRDGEGVRYPAHDEATVVELPLAILEDHRAKMLAEVAQVDAWHDDYPFYNRDGSWSAVSLRGFMDDPAWGVKPAEMNKAWWAEHPDAGSLTCEWTSFSNHVPALTAAVDVMGFRNLERVRLLRMSGRGGKGGELLRHSDITDRAAGTDNGQIARFHLPLVSHPDVVMRTWDLAGVATETHLAPWHLYYLDARKPHAVSNPTAIDRVHLVVDVVMDPAVRAQISRALVAA